MNAARRRAIAASFITAAAMVFLLQRSGMPAWTFAPILLAMAVVAPLSSWMFGAVMAVARWAIGRIAAGPWQLSVGYMAFALAALQLFFFLDLTVALHIMPYTGLTWYESDAVEQVATAAEALLLGATATATIGLAVTLWYMKVYDRPA